MFDETTLAEGRCNCSACPAAWMTEVKVYGQDLYFCLHHYAGLEHALMLHDAEIVQVLDFPDGRIETTPLAVKSPDPGGDTLVKS